MSLAPITDITAYEVVGRELVVLSILVLYLGYFIKHHSSFLRKNNIPVSVVGGLVFSIAAATLAGTGVLDLSFDLSLRNVLLLMFFSTIGLNAKLRELVKGGKALVFLIVACVVFLILQNVVGVSVATALGKEPALGLFGGSIALAGGHGTAIAWGEVALEEGLRGASEFGIACATFGLILGGLFGGPVAGRLIKKHGLKPSGQSPADSSTDGSKAETGSPKKHSVSVEDIIGTVLALGLCLGLGDFVNHHLFNYQIRLPGFLTALIAGVVITNFSDPLKIKLNHEGIDLIGGVSLQLFLSMSLMSMDLLLLMDSAVLLLITMPLQVVLTIVFASQIVFRMMGRDYDAAMIAGGFSGLALGATPVAIASMDAASKEHGPSLKALLIVPLVGAFFIDLINAVTIEGFLRFLL